VAGTLSQPRQLGTTAHRHSGHYTWQVCHTAARRHRGYHARHVGTLGGGTGDIAIAISFGATYVPRTIHALVLSFMFCVYACAEIRETPECICRRLVPCSPCAFQYVANRTESARLVCNSRALSVIVSVTTLPFTFHGLCLAWRSAHIARLVTKRVRETALSEGAKAVIAVRGWEVPCLDCRAHSWTPDCLLTYLLLCVCVCMLSSRGMWQIVNRNYRVTHHARLTWLMRQDRDLADTVVTSSYALPT